MDKMSDANHNNAPTPANDIHVEHDNQTDCRIDIDDLVDNVLTHISSCLPCTELLCQYIE